MHSFLGVVPFLIQWLALMNGGSHPASLGNGQSPLGQTQIPGGFVDQQPPKSYWALLNDLGQLPEDEIEGFLPQMTNILVEDAFAKSMDYQTYGHLRQILLTKCAGCLPFGMRVCSLLEAQSDAPSESIFKVFGGGESSSEGKAERVRYLKQGAEAATFYGNHLPQRVSSLRATYMKDMHTMLEHFARIGRELKSYPVQHRNYHLRSAITALNEMLFNRMLSKGTSLTGHGINLHDLEGSGFDLGIGGGVGPGSEGGIAVEEGLESAFGEATPSTTGGGHGDPPTPPPGIVYPSIATAHGANPQFLQHYQQQQQQVAAMTTRDKAFQPTATTARHVAALCPEVAAYSLHVPLQHCREKVQRLLQFVVSECEILPSKERCPYLLVAEVLEQPFTCKSSELFAQRQPLGLTALDTVQNRGDGLSALHLRTTTSSPSSPPSLSLFSHVDNGRNEDEVDKVIAETGLPSAKEVSAGLDERKESDSVLLFGRHAQARSPPSKESGPVGDLRGGNIPNSNPGQVNYNQYNPTSGSTNNPEAPYYTQSVASDPQDATPPYSRHTQNPPPGAGGYPGQGNNNNMLPPGGVNGPPTGFLQKKFSRIVPWAETEAAVQASSPFGHLPGWSLKSFIVKSGDDLRKEMLAQQVLEMMRQIFDSARLDILLTPYQIVPTGANAGLVEFINTARSIDRMKKSSPDVPTLREYFEYTYGPPYSPRYISAVTNFTRSLVGYSLLTYILQVRDRHNANLLLDDDGSIIHIDFGFILGDSPGMNMNFENAPFKLTREYVELMGGLDSENMRMFQDLFMRGFFALQAHTEGLAAIVQLFYGEKRKTAADGLRSRLMFARTQSDVMSLMKESIDNWRTKQYDWFQQRTNGILM